MADLLKAPEHLDRFDGLPDRRAPRNTQGHEARPRRRRLRGERVRTGEGSCHQDGQGGIRRSINATSRSAGCFASSWQVCDSSENPATAFHGHPLCLKIFDSRLFLPFMPAAHRHCPLVEPVAVLRWPGHLCRASHPSPFKTPDIPSHRQVGVLD